MASGKANVALRISPTPRVLPIVHRRACRSCIDSHKPTCYCSLGLRLEDEVKKRERPALLHLPNLDPPAGSKGNTRVLLRIT